MNTWEIISLTSLTSNKDNTKTFHRFLSCRRFGYIKQEMFVNIKPPKAFFVTDALYNWISQIKISCTNVWSRNPFFGNCHLNNWKRFRNIWPRWPWSLTNWHQNRVSLLTRMDVWTKFEAGRSRRFELLIKNVFGTFDPGDLDLWPCDPKIHRVHLLPRMDVCIRFKEGRSRRSQVIDQKRKG